MSVRVYAHAMNNSEISTPGAPVRAGDIFTTAEHGDVVVALSVHERVPGKVWSVAVQPATEAFGRWIICDWEPARWTSVKVYAGRSRIEILGKVGA